MRDVNWTYLFLEQWASATFINYRWRLCLTTFLMRVGQNNTEPSLTLFTSLVDLSHLPALNADLHLSSGNHRCPRLKSPCGCHFPSPVLIQTTGPQIIIIIWILVRVCQLANFRWYYLNYDPDGYLWYVWITCRQTREGILHYLIRCTHKVYTFALDERKVYTVVTLMVENST